MDGTTLVSNLLSDLTQFSVNKVLNERIFVTEKKYEFLIYCICLSVMNKCLKYLLMCMKVLYTGITNWNPTG